MIKHEKRNRSIKKGGRILVLEVFRINKKMLNPIPTLVKELYMGMVNTVNKTVKYRNLSRIA